MSKTVVHISNRVDIPKPGEATAGGLDEAISSPPDGHAVTRIGWSGRVVSDSEYDPARAVSETTANGVRYITMDFSRSMHDGFYAGTANSFLWPLFHFRTDIARPGFSQEHNRIYMQANRMFADVVQRHVQPDDTLIVHDYHLMPLGRELIRAGVDNPTGFFLHIPAPDADLLEELDRPEQNFIYDLIGDLHAYDLVGLQARRDFESLSSILDSSAGGNAPKPYRTRMIPDLRASFARATQFGVFPVIGKTSQYVEDAQKWESRPETLAFLKENGPADIVGVERLDYSKGIPNKFTALARCHQKGVLDAEKGHFLQVAPFGRQDVLAYQIEKAKAEQAHDMLTTLFGQVATLHMDKVLRQINLGIFRRSKVGLVTPLRDGMNLVAFEYLAAQNPDDPGVLVLSKFAGAAEVLNKGAVLVDPRRPDDIARGIERALSLPQKMRKRMHASAMTAMNSHTNAEWQTALIEGAEKAAIRRPSIAP